MNSGPTRLRPSLRGAFGVVGRGGVLKEGSRTFQKRRWQIFAGCLKKERGLIEKRTINPWRGQAQIRVEVILKTSKVKEKRNAEKNGGLRFRVIGGEGLRERVARVVRSVRGR